ncbi:MAG: lactate utilization protein C [Ferrovibrio sp.]|jgi:L-lactate dehydrogenase complex protein LldG|uniref:LutC/YkgG family protein n=1 Tax=Ferrovibrio sp. TaxID=1917215 RepID=UPI003919D5CB
MSTSRERIFATLRAGLKDLADDPARPHAVAERIKSHPRNLLPQRAQKPHAEQVALFTAKVEALTVTVDRIASAAEAPEKISDYLARHNLPSRLRVAPDPLLQTLPWDQRPMLQVEYGGGRSQDLVSVTPAFAAIAETGTLMLHSSSTTPTTLHFVPDHHIVVLKSSQVTGTMEEAFQRLRDKLGAGDKTAAENWPRTVNFVTGPSRTADIEGVPVLGAHGPRRLHIVLIEDGAETQQG